MNKIKEEEKRFMLFMRIVYRRHGKGTARALHAEYIRCKNLIEKSKKEKISVEEMIKKSARSRACKNQILIYLKRYREFKIWEKENNLKGDKYDKNR